MRVVAGKFKAHLLKMPRGAKVRPTSQKVKAALFNILGTAVRAASFLELFAGSGNIGIEAKSRGAKRVFFVENNRLCLKTIERNLSQLKISYNYGLKAQKKAFEEDVRLLPLEAEKALSILSQKGYKFDFVFLDPPYYQSKLKNILMKIGTYAILNPRGFVIAEHSKDKILPQEFPGIRLMFSKTYGDTVLSFYQLKPKRG